jgi:hypothetical protein
MCVRIIIEELCSLEEGNQINPEKLRKFLVTTST